MFQRPYDDGDAVSDSASGRRRRLLRDDGVSADDVPHRARLPQRCSAAAEQSTDEVSLQRSALSDEGWWMICRLTKSVAGKLKS